MLLGRQSLLRQVPASNSFAILNARVISLVKTEEYNPYSVSFALVRTSSLLEKELTCPIGPKDSIFMISL